MIPGLIINNSLRSLYNLLLKSHSVALKYERRKEKTAFKGDAPHFIKGLPGNMVVLTKTSQKVSSPSLIVTVTIEDRD